jgi:hypothetical protein
MSTPILSRLLDMEAASVLACTPAGWVNLITVALSFMGFIAIGVFFVILHRPLRHILEQFNCGDLIRLKLGPLEIEKQSSRKPVRSHHRKKK